MDSWFGTDPYSNGDIRVALARIDYDLALESRSIRTAIEEAAMDIAISQQALRNENLAPRKQKNSLPTGFVDDADKLKNTALTRAGNEKVDDIDQSKPESEKEQRKENFGAFESEDVVDDF